MTGAGKLFTFKDQDDYGRLREAFQRAGYGDRDVVAALGVSEVDVIKGTDMGILLRRTRGGSPLETLIRLFLMETPVDILSLQHALHPVKLETLAEAGLLRVDGSSVTAVVKVLPLGGLFLAFDRLARLREGHADYVMGVGSSTMNLANLTIRRPMGATLDLGSGCGIHALLAAPHSGRVAAVDCNPRAIGLAAFNARLNGFSNIECLEGNLFEPVEGRTFDLVVSNPPFVISPGQRYIYRDSGMRGDEICRKIVREAARFLNDGGYCQMLCNWVEKRDEEWRETLRPWFEGAGCDVWVIRFQSGEAETYANIWIRGTEFQDSADVRAEFDRWMSYYEREGIERVGLGVINMRRRGGGANWFRAEDGPDKMLGGWGEMVRRRFALTDFLGTVQDDAALLATPLQVSHDIVLDRQYEPTPAGWKEVDATVTFRKGLAYAGKIDGLVADILGCCDGQKPLGEVLAALAASKGIDRDRLTSPSCTIVRQLMERSFLLPAHLAGEDLP